jgi:hypothetical protein
LQKPAAAETVPSGRLNQIIGSDKIAWTYARRLNVSATIFGIQGQQSRFALRCRAKELVVDGIGDGNRVC